MQTDDISPAQDAHSGYDVPDDPDGYFGERIAAGYDTPGEGEFHPDVTGPAVDVLAGLAGLAGRSGAAGPAGDGSGDGSGDGAGPALEFAVGTGRIALPLAARGVPVHGIELSRAMVARLRAKPGGDAIGVTLGDMATTPVEGAAGTFAVAYLVYNTIGNLTTQDAQVAVFANAAAHLRPGGTFVVETGVPNLRSLPPGQTAVPFEVSSGRIGFDTFDTATQHMRSHHVTIGADGSATVLSLPFRYVWPSELDLMARLAGMRLRHRWADWRGTPFTSESGKHVSVWEKPVE